MEQYQPGAGWRIASVSREVVGYALPFAAKDQADAGAAAALDLGEAGGGLGHAPFPAFHQIV